MRNVSVEVSVKMPPSLHAGIMQKQGGQWKDKKKKSLLNKLVCQPSGKKKTKKTCVYLHGCVGRKETFVYTCMHVRGEKRELCVYMYACEGRKKENFVYTCMHVRGEKKRILCIHVCMCGEKKREFCVYMYACVGRKKRILCIHVCMCGEKKDNFVYTCMHVWYESSG